MGSGIGNYKRQMDDHFVRKTVTPRRDWEDRSLCSLGRPFALLIRTRERQRDDRHAKA